jgi:hypothetical protein
MESRDQDQVDPLAIMPVEATRQIIDPFLGRGCCLVDILECHHDSFGLCERG